MLKSIFLTLSIIYIACCFNTIDAKENLQTKSYSLLLFILEDNHITIERYPSSILEQESIILSTEKQPGHTLFVIDFSNDDLFIKDLSFLQEDHHHLLISVQCHDKVIPYLFSWTPLITKQIKTITNFTILSFSNKPTENQTEFLSSINGNKSYHLIIDHPVKTICGAIIEDRHFTYDKGLFARTLSKNQLFTLGFLKPFEEKTVKKIYSAEQLQQAAQQSVNYCKHYFALRTTALKTNFKKSSAYIVAKWHSLKEYFARHNEEKKAIAQLQQNFKSEEELDKLLDDTMNSDLNFINDTKQPFTLPSWAQKMGTYLLLRYIACEQKIRQWWQWFNKTSSEKLADEK